MIAIFDQNVAKAPNYMWICFWRRTQGVSTHNGILKNCTVANIAIKAFLRV